MKKKLLTIVPLFALLASCNGAATVSEPIPSYVPSGASEMDVYEPSQIQGQEKRESSFSNSVKQSAKAFENAEAYELKEEMNFTTDIALKAKVAENLLSPFVSTKDPTYVNAAASVRATIDEKSEAGLGGFNKENAKMEDLVAYSSLNKLDAAASLEYVVPESYLALAFQGESPIDAVGSADYSISNFGLDAYLKNGKAYASIDENKAKNIYDTLLATDFIDFTSLIPAEYLTEGEQGQYQVPSFDELLSTFGLETLGVSLTLPLEELSSFDFSNLDLYSQIPEDFFSQASVVDDFIKDNAEILKTLNFRAFSFDNENDYLLSLSLNINKDTISSFYNMFKKENDISFDELLAKYNGLISKFNVELEMNILRNGGVELSLKGDINFKLDLTSLVLEALKLYMTKEYPMLGEVEGIDEAIAKIIQSVSLEFGLSGNASLKFSKVALSEITSKIPANFEGYQDVTSLIEELYRDQVTPIE